MNKRTLDISGKQVLRGLILEICEKAEPLGAGLEVIQSALKKAGADYSREDIEAACAYLEGKGFVILKTEGNEALRITRCIARITAVGIDFIEGSINESGIERA